MSGCLRGVSWNVAADIATTLGTLVALIGVAGSLYLTLRSERLTRKGQELERQQADSAASRAEAAAALTEEYTRRVVVALERMAETPGVPQGLAAPSVRWALVHEAGDTYKLENVGGLEAESVEVSTHESMITRLPGQQNIGVGEAITFLAVRTLATQDSTVRVTWGPEGSRQEWRYPLPARPPR